MNPQPRSATEPRPGGRIRTAARGERFARALATKDRAELSALLTDPVDFAALTPGRHWQATDRQEVVEEIILGRWFGPDDDILELVSVATGHVSACGHVAYRVRVRRAGRPHLVEQQLYYGTDGDRITRMRILCSGYQPLDG